MKASHHVAVSALASTCLQITVRSWELTIATFMSGIFIDLDHYIDYLMEYSSPCDMKKFFHCIYEEKLRKIRMLFHSWELLVVLSIMGWISTWNPWILGITIGCGLHMVLDAVFNTNWPVSGYSLFWRWKNDFIAEAIRPRKSEMNR